MSFLSPNFVIGEIKIGTIEGASCVNLGNNLPIGFESYKKSSQGFGSISGDNNNIEEIAALLNDLSKINIYEEDDDIPDWTKRLIADKLAESKR
ncbi:hypothetical protein U472_09625 [Orenia metallireducens]|jgi:hypothetical protein|uniref:Uncharacterized protein n=1 Tax=Orenia metallireducens TaxID=1413210 RepID=A0A1C0A7Q9_9FIRM|nr:hypothetical protein [Orenia metallireducens]OCL26260.1 hypothetical protein U472_09625 [Orenia metallireducens]